MTDLFKRIEDELLVAAAGREPRLARRGRGRRLSLVVVASVGAGVTGSAVAGMFDTPVDRLLGEPEVSGREPGSQRVDLRVGGGPGGAWHAALFIGPRGMISMTAAPQEVAGRRPAASGASTLAMGMGFLDDGPMRTSAEMRRAGGRTQLLVYGVADESVRSVSVRLAAQEADAVMSEDVLEVPVVIPYEDLTPLGREQVKRLPDELRMRLFAAAFALEGNLAEPPAGTVVAVLEDGSRRTMPLHLDKLPTN